MLLPRWICVTPELDWSYMGMILESYRRLIRLWLVVYISLALKSEILLNISSFVQGFGILCIIYIEQDVILQSKLNKAI